MLRSSFQQIAEILREFESDFKRISRFFRSFALKEFQKQVGWSLGDLTCRIGNILADLQKSSPQVNVNLVEWEQILQKLQTYIDASMHIMGKYVKDPTELQATLDVLAARKAMIPELARCANPIT